MAEISALQRVRADLSVYGVHMVWEHRREGGRIRLYTVIRGRVDAAARSYRTPDGRVPVNASQHSGYQAAAFALTLLQPLYPFACMTGRGGVAPSGEWACEVWLDPSEREMLALQASGDMPEPHKGKA